MSPLAFSLRFLQAQPDAKLVDLARAGHEPAFEALVRRYRRQLLGYCRRMGHANAEDALQQTFLQAWLALSAGLEVRDARPWLYRIAHNVIVSNARHQGELGVQLYEGLGVRAADDEAEQRMVARDALAGLAALPGLQRAVMLGTAVDGLSQAEIARELGLTSGAVRGLIYRARSTLRAAAAAVIPSPLVEWAARHGTTPRTGSTGVYEALASGGGSAGVGGLLIKSGAIAATAGVLVTAAGSATHHADAPHRGARTVHVVASAGHGRSRVFGPAGTSVALPVSIAAQPEPPGLQPRLAAAAVLITGSPPGLHNAATGDAQPIQHWRADQHGDRSHQPDGARRRNGTRASTRRSREGGDGGGSHDGPIQASQTVTTGSQGSDNGGANPGSDQGGSANGGGSHDGGGTQAGADSSDHAATQDGGARATTADRRSPERSDE